MKVWFVGSFIRCVENLVFVGRPIGIQSPWWTVHRTWRLAYVDIKKANNKCTYDLITHVLKNFLWSYWSFETRVALTYTIDFDSYELHLGDEKVLNDLMMNARIWLFTYDGGWLSCKSVLMLMTIYECNVSLYLHVVTYIIIIENVLVLLDFANEKLVHRRFVGICCEHTWFMVFNERCTPLGGLWTIGLSDW